MKRQIESAMLSDPSSLQHRKYLSETRQELLNSATQLLKTANADGRDSHPRVRHAEERLIKSALLFAIADDAQKNFQRFFGNQKDSQ